MSTISYLLSPVNIYVYSNPNFFNEPHEELSCRHCDAPMDYEKSVKLVPALHQDTKYGSKHQREAKVILHEIMHGNKLCCSLACVKAYLNREGQSLFLSMCKNVYKIPLVDALRMLPALPFSSLKKFGGILSLDQFRQWMRESRLVDVKYTDPHSGKDKKFSFDARETDNPLESYRQLVVKLELLNRFHRFRFDPKDPFWYGTQEKSTALSCWNKCGSLAGVKPIPAVLEYDTDTQDARECTGFFCSLPCSIAFICRLKGQFEYQRILWQSMFYTHRFNENRLVKAMRARSTRLLKKFGGNHDLDLWRGHEKTEGTPLEIAESQMRYVRCAPQGQDFPFYGRPNAFGYYEEVDEKLEFSIIQYMSQSKSVENDRLQMNGDEYGKNIRRFLKTYHVVEGNGAEDMKLHFLLNSIEVRQEKKSNDEIFRELVENSGKESISANKLN